MRTGLLLRQTSPHTSHPLIHPWQDHRRGKQGRADTPAPPRHRRRSLVLFLRCSSRSNGAGSCAWCCPSRGATPCEGASSVAVSVAYHPSAQREAEARGLADALARFRAPDQDQMHILTLIDMSTDPTGEPIAPCCHGRPPASGDDDPAARQDRRDDGHLQPGVLDVDQGSAQTPRQPVRRGVLRSLLRAGGGHAR